MSRGDQLHRQWSILQHLSEGRKSRREFAKDFDVSLKTITRDIDALSIFPIAEEREGIDVYYRLLRGFEAPGIQFSPEEVAALVLGKRTVLNALENSPYEEAFASALAKVELLQKDNAYRKVKALPQVFQSSFFKPQVQNDFQEQLLTAAIEHRVVWLKYFTVERQAISEREVEPFFLHQHPHGFHLIGYCLKREDFLQFGINHIQEIKVLEKTFAPEERAFDLDAFLRTVFDGHRSLPILDVRLHIKYPTAHWARERFYHHSQQIKEVEEGIELHFRSGGSEAIVSRILSLGPDCEVLSPPELQKRVAEKSKEISMLYEK